MNTETAVNRENEALKVYLREEIGEIRKRLGQLKGNMKEDDFNALQEELNERSETLEALDMGDDSQLFLLRREIGTIRERVEARAVKARWWSKITGPVWIAIFTLPIVLYFFVLSIMQLQSQAVINASATQTAAAMPTMVSNPPETPVP